MTNIGRSHYSSNSVCVSLFYVIDTGSIGSRTHHVTGWGLPIYPPPFKLAQTLPTPKPCRSTPSLIGSPSRHRGSGKNLGHCLWFGTHQHEVSDVPMMLNSPWPEGSERSNVSSNTWCPRKNLCVPRNWEFRHATRILDVIMLKYPLKVCPIPGIWV